MVNWLCDDNWGRETMFVRIGIWEVNVVMIGCKSYLNGAWNVKEIIIVVPSLNCIYYVSS